MPNRILREGILTSERIAKLSWPAEVFYRRLMSVVDDFGRYHATPMLLRAACYPLGLDRVSDSDVGKWLGETRKAALVGTYQVEGKSYLVLQDFRQQVRATTSKFPPPPDDAQQMPSTCVADAQQTPAPAHLDGDGVVVDRKTLSGKPDAPALRDQAKQILQFLNAKAERNYQPVDANLEFIVARLKEGATEGQLRQVVAKKCREWGADEKMSGYLRPATLFNRTKFAQYVGELT
jgi:uncharacterized phage protein (TIGR02220 family)